KLRPQPRNWSARALAGVATASIATAKTESSFDTPVPSAKNKWGGFCCQAPPRAPPQVAKTGGLKCGQIRAALRSEGLAFSKVVVGNYCNGLLSGPKRAKSSPLHVRRSCVGPRQSGQRPGRNLVEPPGTAPGSGPLITRGFIAIVPCGNTTNIGPRRLSEKNLR